MSKHSYRAKEDPPKCFRKKCLRSGLHHILIVPLHSEFLLVTRGGKKYFGHAGVDQGFVARYWGSFDGGNGVVVMSNTQDLSIVNEIINSVAIVYKWKGFPFMVLKHVDVSDDTLNAYAGQYQNTTESDGQYKLIPGTIFTIPKTRSSALFAGFS